MNLSARSCRSPVPFVLIRSGTVSHGFADLCLDDSRASIYFVSHRQKALGLVAMGRIGRVSYPEELNDPRKTRSQNKIGGIVGHVVTEEIFRPTFRDVSEWVGIQDG